MPQIPVYEVPGSEQRLSIPDSGAATLAQAGRRAGALGNEAAASWKGGFDKLAAGVGQLGTELDAKQTAHETSQILPKLAIDQAQRMQDINGIAYGSDPNEITTKLNQYKSDVLDPAKERFLSGFGTSKAKETAEAAWGRYEADLYHHASAVSIQASGDAQHNNLVGGNNQLITNVGKDPSLLDHNLELADAAINGAASSPAMASALKHTLTTSYSQTVKSEMVANAIKTQAEANPSIARQMIASGKYDQYIGQHVGTLNTYIDTQERLAATKAKADDVQARQVETDTAKQALSDTMLKTITPQGIRVDGSYFEELKKTMALPGAERNPDLMKAFVDYGQAAMDRQAKGIKTTTDPATFNTLSARMFDQENPLKYQETFGAWTQGKLSDHDLSHLNEGIAKNEHADMAGQSSRRLIDNTFATARSVLNPGADPFSGLDPEAKARGALDYSNYTRAAQVEWDHGMAKGMSPAQLQKQLTDPAYINQFKSNPAQASLYGAQQATQPAATTPKKPDAGAFWGIFGGSK